MGLITGLLTLPLAPVRGTMRVADLVKGQAENEAYDETAIRSRLLELEEARERGDYREEEIEAAENALLERLIEIRGFGGQVNYGEPE